MLMKLTPVAHPIKLFLLHFPIFTVNLECYCVGLEASRGGLNERSSPGGLSSTGVSGGAPSVSVGAVGTGSSLVSDHLSELQRIVTSHKAS